MRTVFGDTGFFVALLNPRDELHDLALALRDQLRPFHLVTSEIVLTEFLNDFSARGAVFRGAAAQFVNELRRSSLAVPASAAIVPQTVEQFAAAFAVFRDRTDKAWSLTDCASFLIMQQVGIREALSHDRHFEQMGYRALLRRGS
ncbi:MAG: type II toxin-antitoxin system VapC family toxin [Phycisphaerales bacterium]|nr:type II toxin-antitoxin system VapC family toxin [Phycisphaerales bacterium]